MEYPVDPQRNIQIQTTNRSIQTQNDSCPLRLQELNMDTS